MKIKIPRRGIFIFEKKRLPGAALGGELALRAVFCGGFLISGPLRGGRGPPPAPFPFPGARGVPLDPGLPRTRSGSRLSAALPARDTARFQFSPQPHNLRLQNTPPGGVLSDAAGHHQAPLPHRACPLFMMGRPPIQQTGKAGNANISCAVTKILRSGDKDRLPCPEKGLNAAGTEGMAFFMEKRSSMWQISWKCEHRALLQRPPGSGTSIGCFVRKRSHRRVKKGYPWPGKERRITKKPSGSRQPARHPY